VGEFTRALLESAHIFFHARQSLAAAIPRPVGHRRGTQRHQRVAALASRFASKGGNSQRHTGGLTVRRGTAHGRLLGVAPALGIAEAMSYKPQPR
jgi:hypothetical protein